MFLALHNQYFSGNFTDVGVVILHSPDDLFLFASRNTSMFKERRLARLIRAWAAVPPTPSRIKTELLVFHWKDGAVKQSVIAGMGLEGSPFVFQDRIYWMKGSLPEDEHGSPHLWQWENAQFMALDEQRWSELKIQIHKEFKYIDNEMNAKWGWKVESVSLNGQNSTLGIDMRAGRIVIQRETTSLPDNLNRVAIKLATSDGQSAIVFDQINGYREISREEFERPVIVKQPSDRGK